MFGGGPYGSRPLGSAPQDLTNLVLSAAAGVFALVGKPVALLHQRLLTAIKGTFAFVGKTASLLRTRLLNAVRGIFSFTGMPSDVPNTGPPFVSFPTPSALIHRAVAPILARYRLSETLLQQSRTAKPTLQQTRSQDPSLSN